MQTRVIITDTQGEESFELTDDLSPKRLDHLKWIAERVAQDTRWDVTISVERQP